MKIAPVIILIPILSEGIGYGILLGVGLVTAIVVTALTRTESKWLGTKKTFEWFIPRAVTSIVDLQLHQLSHLGRGPLPFFNHQ